MTWCYGFRSSVEEISLTSITNNSIPIQADEVIWAGLIITRAGNGWEEDFKGIHLTGLLQIGRDWKNWDSFPSRFESLRPHFTTQLPSTSDYTTSVSLSLNQKRFFIFYTDPVQISWLFPHLLHNWGPCYCFYLPLLLLSSPPLVSITFDATHPTGLPIITFESLILFWFDGI